jgi:DNA-binding MarR family transcriptional regulator
MGYVNMEEKMNKMMDSLLGYLPLFYMEIFNSKDLRDELPRNYMIIINSKYYENQPISVMADKLSISRSHMTGHIDQLVKEGLLKKVPDNKDRRIIRVTTTSKGRAVRDKYLKIFEKHIEDKLTILSPEELEEYYTCIDTIQNVVSKFLSIKN